MTTEDYVRQKPLSASELELVQRILATPAFTRSMLLTRFLQYICDRNFSGRPEEITEYQIGVHALGRSDSYNPGDDNIVRTYARILRKRLEEYFRGVGQDEPVRIIIPVGRYFPVFEPNLPAASLRDPVDAELPAVSDVAPSLESQAGIAKVPLWRSLSRFWIPATLLLLVTTIGVERYWQNHTPFRDVKGIFWREVFKRDNATYLVPGDDGLIMIQQITGREVHLSEYLDGTLDKQFHDLRLASTRRGGALNFDRMSNLTSKVYLSVTAGAAGLAQRYGGQLKISYPRYMNMESFKGANVILAGSPRANPWVELFEPESNFSMYFPVYDDAIHFNERTFINKRPLAGEQSTYSIPLNDTSHRAYALLSFLPGMNGADHILMLQGGGTPGTEAAADFLFNEGRMEPILRKAQLPDGSIGPFEVLLEARTVGANAPEEHAVVERYGVFKASER